MPYSIGKQDSKWVVRKKGGSKIFGRHSTKKKALAQQAALYANEDFTPSEISLLMEATELETIGRPVGATHGAIWIDESGDCHLILQMPDDINLAAGDLTMVVIYFYGEDTRRIVDEIIYAGTSEKNLEQRAVDIGEIIRDNYSLETWVNLDKQVVLVMPDTETMANPPDVVDELEANGYESAPISYYHNADEIESVYTRPS